MYIVQYCTMYIVHIYLATQLVEADGVGKRLGAGLHGEGHLRITQGEPVEQSYTVLILPALLGHISKQTLDGYHVQLVPAITARKNRLKNCNSNEYLLMGWSESHTRTSLTISMIITFTPS